MAQKIVDTIHRTGNSTSPIRQLVVTQGSGKSAVETVLSTPIQKIEFGLSFRNGGAHTPIEQYHFRVGKKVVERFADAVSLVLKKHNIALAGQPDSAQQYIQRAYAIIAGNDSLREVKAEA